MKKILFGMLLSMTIGVQVFAQYLEQLEKAIDKGNVEEVQQLLQTTKVSMNDHGTDLIVKAIFVLGSRKGSNPEQAPLYNTTFYNIIQLLLNAGASINNEFGRRIDWRNVLHNPLHVAIAYHDTDLVSYLIQKGADVNFQQNQYMPTPLHFIARHLCYSGGVRAFSFVKKHLDDLLDIAKMLIDNGAKKDSTLVDTFVEGGQAREVSILDTLFTCGKYRPVVAPYLERLIDLIRDSK